MTSDDAPPKFFRNLLRPVGRAAVNDDDLGEAREPREAGGEVGFFVLDGNSHGDRQTCSDTVR